MKKKWLEENRPDLWLPELRKTPNMSAAKRGGKRSIRLRRINRNLVIPERVSSMNKNFLNSDNDTDNIFLKTLLFLRPDDDEGSGGTLSQNKHDVYIILKICKFIFDVIITSFILKFGIDRALEDDRQGFI